MWRRRVAYGRGDDLRELADSAWPCTMILPDVQKVEVVSVPMDFPVVSVR